MHQDKVSDIEVSIRGEKILIPKAAYEDLAGPVLNNTALIVSFGSNGGASYQLEFFLADPSKDYVALEDMELVSFLIENNKLVERDIYKNKARTKLVSSIKFNGQ